MGKYRRFTKRRRQRAGAFGLPSFKDLVPSGFPTSLADLKTIVTDTVERVPALKTVSGAVGKISDVSTTLTTVSSTITNLPEVIKTNVTGVVDAQLAKAGIPPIGTGSGPVKNDSGPVKDNDPGSANTESNNTESNDPESNNSESNDPESNNSESNNTESNDPESNNSENANAAGGGRSSGSTEYELVTLSRPVSDPLFVCFKSGKAVYFTRGAKGVRILTNGNVGQKTKRRRR
jgi:hypothetical protein